METTSTRHLTAEVFVSQQAKDWLGRARALREATLVLMDSLARLFYQTGKVTASYAHPSFGAPFFLVGEGATDVRPVSQ